MFWGLTGCSGTGVSTVASVWESLGAQICSLDKTGHRFLDKMSVKKALEQELDIQGLSNMSTIEIRNELREKAFLSKEILSGINRVVHPRLIRWVTSSTNKLKSSNDIFVLDAALIFELDLSNYFNFVVTVTDSIDRVSDRLVKRDGISPETISGRWNSQLSLKTKCENSHFVLHNSGTEFDLKKKAKEFYKGVIQKMEASGGTQN